MYGLRACNFWNEANVCSIDIRGNDTIGENILYKADQGVVNLGPKLLKELNKVYYSKIKCCYLQNYSTCCPPPKKKNLKHLINKKEKKKKTFTKIKVWNLMQELPKNKCLIVREKNQTCKNGTKQYV